MSKLKNNKSTCKNTLVIFYILNIIQLSYNDYKKGEGMINNIQVEKNNSTPIKIVKGLIISFIVTLVTIFIFSIILTYTNISEVIIPAAIIVLTFVSILIGTIISMKRTSKNGLINGAIIGGAYVILLYVISSSLNTGFALNGYTIRYDNFRNYFRYNWRYNCSKYIIKKSRIYPRFFIVNNLTFCRS